MIPLEEDQEVLLQPEYLVKEAGNYDDLDLVVVYRKCQPDQEVAFIAIYIATGVNP